MPKPNSRPRPAAQVTLLSYTPPRSLRPSACAPRLNTLTPYILAQGIYLQRKVTLLPLCPRRHAPVRLALCEGLHSLPPIKDRAFACRPSWCQRRQGRPAGSVYAHGNSTCPWRLLYLRNVWPQPGSTFACACSHLSRWRRPLHLQTVLS